MKMESGINGETQTDTDDDGDDDDVELLIPISNALHKIVSNTLWQFFAARFLFWCHTHSMCLVNRSSSIVMQ